ncbi:DinB family protein [Desertimonas flava]|jgi:hypothetical protein|uniref:DinB family protein n=1 Tax=Desertimonas flava TaxID=2064846 RepID=UPI000E352331|nr:DinB family protein [Desertimonas flava]
MSAVEQCDSCGFAWDAVPFEMIELGIPVTMDRITEIVEEADDEGHAYDRPDADTWSIVEYAAHIRDVLLVMRDRLVVGLVEQGPAFSPMYRDERVRGGLYRFENADDLGHKELPVAADLFLRLLRSIDRPDLARPVRYNYPVPSDRTLLWVAQQTLHEVMHHRQDLERIHRCFRDR